METLSADLVGRWRDGDQQAAAELFHRYSARLLALARSRLPSALARHVDPEDVVQSGYQSFFAGAREGRFVFQRRGDLWRLLVGITMHKLKHQIERFTARKRAGAQKDELVADSKLFGLTAQMLARDPTPSKAAAATDMLDQVLRGLEPVQRRMLSLRLDGYSLEEIANEVRRSERTVRRVLEEVKQRLQRECLGNTGL